MRRTTSVAIAALCAALMAGGEPTYAIAVDDDGVERRGSCSNGASWKMKAEPSDGRFDIEVEIDTDRPGTRWTWVLRHNGSLSDRGSTRTTFSSGSVRVERTAIDASGGVDTLRFRAWRKSTVCVAQVQL